MDNIIYDVLCITLGYFGVHKFYKKDTKMGIIYLCTLGLFGCGWIIDSIKAILDIVNMFKAEQDKTIQNGFKQRTQGPSMAWNQSRRQCSRGGKGIH